MLLRQIKRFSLKRRRLRLQLSNKKTDSQLDREKLWKTFHSDRTQVTHQLWMKRIMMEEKRQSMKKRR